MSVYRVWLMLCVLGMSSGGCDDAPDNPQNPVLRASRDAQTERPLENRVRDRLLILSQGFVEKANQLTLYHQILKGLPRDAALDTAIRSLPLDSLSGANERTAALYLKGSLEPRVNLPHPNRPTRRSRAPSLLEHVNQLCQTSSIFSLRLSKALGPTFRKHCASEKGDGEPTLSLTNVASIVHQSLRTNSRAQARRLLLLAISDEAYVASTLVVAPKLSLGQSSNLLHMLGGLDLALLAYASNPSNLMHLEKLLKDEGLSTDQRRRLLFTLGWFGVDAALPHLHEIFVRPADNGARHATQALGKLIARVTNKDVVGSILKAMYEADDQPDRVFDAVPAGTLTPSFLAKLASEALGRNPSHGKAWRHCKEHDVALLTDWALIIGAHKNLPEKRALLLHNIHQIKPTLNAKGLEALKALLMMDLSVNERQAIIESLDRNAALTASILSEAVKDGLPAALLIEGRNASNPTRYFLTGLQNTSRERAERFALALIKDAKVLRALKSRRRIATALVANFKEDEDNYAFLRCLKLLVKGSPTSSRFQYETLAMKSLPRFVKKPGGPIHTDALVILETINSKKNSSPDQRRHIAPARWQ